jgi:hypothetical protein
VLLGLASVVLACSGGSDGGGIDVPVTTDLRFVKQPGAVQTNEPFSVSVELVGQNGKRLTTLTSTVTLSLVGGGTIDGTTSVAAVAGLATFSGLSMPVPGSALQITATASGISATSASFAAADACAAVAIAFPANVNASFPSQYCSADGKRATFLQFSRPNTGFTRFSVTAANVAFAPEIAIVPAGLSEFISFTLKTGFTGYTEGQWVLPTGSYRMRVIAASGTAGAFVISGSTTVSCVIYALLPFTTATYTNRIEPGNTSLGDCPTRTADVFTIYSTKPCTFTMRGALASFDAFLFVSTEANAIITTDDNSGGGIAGKDARISLPSCRDGSNPIKITATTSSTPPTTTGDYTLQVEITGGIALRR